MMKTQTIVDTNYRELHRDFAPGTLGWRWSMWRPAVIRSMAILDLHRPSDR